MKSLKVEKHPDRIQGDTIFLHDYGDTPRSKTIKKVEILTPNGDLRLYQIKRTAKGRYLFN